MTHPRTDAIGPYSHPDYPAVTTAQAMLDELADASEDIIDTSGIGTWTDPIPGWGTAGWVTDAGVAGEYFLAPITSATGAGITAGNLTAGATATLGVTDSEASLTLFSPGTDGSDLIRAVAGGSSILRVKDNSTIGFFGKTPVARSTGVAVTAEAIHAALVSLGLITA